MIKVINMDTGEGYNKIVFPDSQEHVVISENTESSIACKVICSLTSPGKLIELALVVDACYAMGLPVWSIHIPYLMGARYDRRINPGDSFDLKVFADIINTFGVDQIHLYDPHSTAAQLLIKGAIVHDNKPLVEAYGQKDAVLIVPDAGAAKKAEEYPKWNPNIVDTVQCLKKRDLQTGKVLGVQIFDGEKCAGKNCVIIDDLCDGGRTFTEIVKELREQGWIPDHMTLIVTHGLFSKGFADLSKCFDHIITSTSYNPVTYEGGTYKPSDSFSDMKVEVIPFSCKDDYDD